MSVNIEHIFVRYVVLVCKLRVRSVGIQVQSSGDVAFQLTALLKFLTQVASLVMPHKAVRYVVRSYYYTP